MKKKIQNLIKKIEKVVNKEKVFIGFNITLLLGALILLGTSVFYMISDFQKDKYAIEYDAKIKSVEYQNESYIAEISYDVENNTYIQKITLEDDKKGVNDTIKIKYNKNNPNLLVYNDHKKELLIFIPIGLVLFILSTKALLTYYFKFYRIKKLKREGILIYAEIEEIYLNNRGKKKKGYYPYHIRLKYKNPKDDAIYIFESNDIYSEEKNVIEEKSITKLPVYLTPSNTYNYYVDVDSVIE